MTATTNSGLDLSKPVKCLMVRKSGRILSHQDNADNLCVGRYMANGGKTDGAVQSITWYPDGGYVVVAVARKDSPPKYVGITGDFEVEVMA